MAAADRTLSDVLLLLTKVSSQLDGKLNKLEKLVSVKKKEKEDVREEDNVQAKQANNIEKLLASQIKEKEPEKVVEEETMVQITSFGKDAETYLSKLIGSAAPKPVVVKEQKEEEEGLVSKLMKFLPMVGLVIGGLGGFLSSLLSGDFKNVLDQIKEGNFLGALQTAGKIILKTVEPYIQSIPIIGPIYSFAQAYLQIEKGNIVPGLKYIAQGVVGLLPLPRAVKAAMIGGVSVIGAIIEKKYPQIKIPEGKGGDVLPIALKAIGKVLKIGVLKRLPLLGSAINFYEAYTAFEAGGPAGIAKGIINLSSGIANLFPGYGTLISIGLDIMSSLIFAEEETKDQSGRTVKKIKMSDFFFKAKEFLKNAPVIGNMISLGESVNDFANGNIKGGLINLAKAVPFAGSVISLIEMQKETATNVISSYRAATGIKSFYKILQRSMTISLIKMFPDAFGIRAKVAEYFDIPLNEVNATTEPEIPESPSKANVDAFTPKPKKEEGIEEANEFLSKSYERYQKEQATALPPETPSTLPSIPVNPNEKVETILNQQSKTSDENKKILENLSEAQSSLLSKQLEVMNKHTALLTEIKQNLLKTGTNIISSPTVVSNNYNQGVSLRGLQGVPA